jgi:hypothetical protein
MPVSRRPGRPTSHPGRTRDIQKPEPYQRRSWQSSNPRPCVAPSGRSTRSTGRAILPPSLAHVAFSLSRSRFATLDQLLCPASCSKLVVDDVLLLLADGWQQSSVVLDEAAILSRSLVLLEPYRGNLPNSCQPEAGYERRSLLIDVILDVFFGAPF